MGPPAKPGGGGRGIPPAIVGRGVGGGIGAAGSGVATGGPAIRGGGAGMFCGGGGRAAIGRGVAVGGPGMACGGGGVGEVSGTGEVTVATSGEGARGRPTGC